MNFSHNCYLCVCVSVAIVLSAFSASSSEITGSKAPDDANIRENKLTNQNRRAQDPVLTSEHIPGDFQELDNKRRPNILILLADDLGYGDVGCFGNTTLRTSNIDRLCKEGVKLTQHLAAASVCTPSRAALLTGKYPIRSGMVPTNVIRVPLFPSASGGLDPSQLNVAHIAKKAGYRTGLVGKWHLGMHGNGLWPAGGHKNFQYHPSNQGFDFFYGHPLTNMKDYDGKSSVFEERLQNYPRPIIATLETILLAATLWGFVSGCFSGSRKFCVSWRWVTLVTFIIVVYLDKFLLHSVTELTSMLMRNAEVVESPMRLHNLTSRLVQEGKAFMESKPGTPFLLFMSWIQVHTALHCADSFRGKSSHGFYGDVVEELDWSVGEIVNHLRTLGIDNNTLVYFSSDNGGHSEETDASGIVAGGYNGIFKGGKAQGGMEGGIRVPSVVSWKGVLPQDTEISFPTSQMDIAPTIAHILNIQLNSTWYPDGKNILNALRGQNADASRFLLHYCANRIHAARYYDGSRTWKVHFYTPAYLPGTEKCTSFVCDCFWDAIHHDPPLLYDVTSDPAEESPIPPSHDSYSTILKMIDEYIKEHRKSLGHVDYQMTWKKILPRQWLQPCCESCARALCIFGGAKLCTCTDPKYTFPTPL